MVSRRASGEGAMNGDFESWNASAASGVSLPTCDTPLTLHVMMLRDDVKDGHIILPAEV